MFDQARYEEASRALGCYDSRKEVDWLLTFARTALDKLPQADREGIRYRLWCLTNRGQLGLGNEGPPDIQMGPEYGDGWGEDGILPTDEEVRSAQSHVRRTLDSLVSWHEVALELGPIKLEIFTKYTRGRQTAVVTMEADTVTTQLNLRLATLLRLHGGYLRECGRCQRRFLARRKDQTFCSHVCMNREMQRRDRERKRAKAEIKNKDEERTVNAKGKAARQPPAAKKKQMDRRGST